MAITQSRMLALIKIADDFKDQLLFFNRIISSTITDLPRNPSHEELLAAIQTIQNINNGASINGNALEILAIEKAHFKQNATRNARLAAKARMKRGLDPDLSAPRSTAPASIARQVTSDYQEFFQKSTSAAIRSPAPRTQIYTGAATPYRKVQVLSDEQLAQYMDLELAENKMKINKFCESVKMPAPYPDPLDDSVPLSDDHKRHLGLPIDDDDASPV